MLLLKPLSTMLHQIKCLSGINHMLVFQGHKTFNQKKFIKPNGLNAMLVTVYHLHSTRSIFCYMACSNKQTGFPYSPQLYYVKTQLHILSDSL